MVTFPNAKINLGLNVERRRPDGYHDIATVMVPVGWSDILEVVPARGEETTLTVSGRPVDCPPERNLVMRAWREMLLATGDMAPVDIYLHKVIPDGAGLGGGSSDAAFTIRALNAYFEMGLSDAEMAAIAARVGSDCPFFIYDRPMLCTGKGAEMEPFDMPDLGACRLIGIAKPPQSVSTAEAYAGVKPSVAEPPVADAVAMGPLQWSRVLRNDFEPSVSTRCRAVPTLKAGFADMGAVYTAMTGSGSAVYGIFDADKMSEASLDEAMRHSMPECECYVGRLWPD